MHFGRPKTDVCKNIRISTYVTSLEAEKLKASAKRLNLSVSQYVSRLIEFTLYGGTEK